MKFFICFTFWLLGILLSVSLHYSFITNDESNGLYDNKENTRTEKVTNIKTGTYYKRTTD